MSKVDLALDDIIGSVQQSVTQFRAGNRRAPHVDESLSPATRNNIFGRRNSFGGGRRRFEGTYMNRGGGDNDVIWINIANLPDTVLNADLQELFQDYSVFGIGVHYDELGAHMGTADLFTDAVSAQAIMRDFSDIAIDGSKMRFAIVSEQASNTPQFARSRVQRNGTGGFGRTSFRNNRRGGNRSNSNRSSRTYSRSRSRSPLARSRAPVMGRGRGGGGGQRPKSNQTTKTADELDRELEAYMNGNKHPRIQLEN